MRLSEWKKIFDPSAISTSRLKKNLFHQEPPPWFFNFFHSGPSRQGHSQLFFFFSLSLYFSLIFDLAELNERPVQNPFLPESPPCFDCQFKGWVAPRPPLPRRTAGPALFGGGLTFFSLFFFPAVPGWRRRRAAPDREAVMNTAVAAARSECSVLRGVLEGSVFSSWSP